jgi:hypothetical protein
MTSHWARGAFLSCRRVRATSIASKFVFLCFKRKPLPTEGVHDGPGVHGIDNTPDVVALRKSQ